MKWNDKNYNAVVADYPALSDKPESVALAVWSLKQNADMTPDDWRSLSKETGVKIAGRAVGSARAILGLAPKTQRKAAKGKRTGRGPGRPKGSGRKAVRVDASGSIEDLVSVVRTLQQERDAALDALAKVRSIVDSL